MRFGSVAGRASALSLTLGLCLAGCSGDPDRIAAVPASGTVTFQGKPLEAGSVQFIPAKGRPAAGPVKNGSFVLTTYEDGDGAIPGSHAVVVTAYKEVKVAGNAEPEQKLVTPEKFANAGSSGIAIEIPPGGKTDIKISLD